MADYPNATDNLKEIVRKINSHTGEDKIPKDVKSEITSVKEEIKEMVEQNDQNQAKIFNILIQKIRKLEEILK